MLWNKHNACRTIYISLHNLKYINFFGWNKIEKIFAFSLEKIRRMVYSIYSQGETAVYPGKSKLQGPWKMGRITGKRHRFWKIREILKPQYMWFASRKKQYILRFSKIIFLFLPLICEEYGTAFRKFFRYGSCGKSQKQEVKFPVIFLKHSFFTAVNILSLLPVWYMEQDSRLQGCGAVKMDKERLSSVQRASREKEDPFWSRFF